MRLVGVARVGREVSERGVWSGPGPVADPFQAGDPQEGRRAVADRGGEPSPELPFADVEVREVGQRGTYPRSTSLEPAYREVDLTVRHSEISSLESLGDQRSELARVRGEPGGGTPTSGSPQVAEIDPLVTQRVRGYAEDTARAAGLEPDAVHHHPDWRLRGPGPGVGPGDECPFGRDDQVKAAVGDDRGPVSEARPPQAPDVGRELCGWRELGVRRGRWRRNVGHVDTLAAPTDRWPSHIAEAMDDTGRHGISPLALSAGRTRATARRAGPC